MPIARPTMFASASGELKTRVPPNSFWSPQVTLKTAALPLDLPEHLVAGGVGDVLPEDDDARIAPHLVLHARVQEIHHRGRLPGRDGLARKRRARRVDRGE